MFLFLQSVKCLDQERYNFRKIRRKREEKFDDFFDRLNQQAKKCSFEDPKSQLKDQIIEKCANDALRREAFKRDMTLKELVMFGINFKAPKKKSISSKSKNNPTKTVNTSKESQRNQSQELTNSKDEKKSPNNLKSKSQAKVLPEPEHKTHKISKQIIEISDSDPVSSEVSSEISKKK